MISVHSCRRSLALFLNTADSWYDGNGLSILAHEQAWLTDEPIVFELIDHERDVTYGVREIPPPQQAARLLIENGQPPEEED